MDLRKLDDTCSVSPQIVPADVPKLAAAGFRTLMCNRPDDEEPGQPTADDLAEAARSCGMAFVHLPISGGVFRDVDIAAFGNVLAGDRGPVLAFCRTGTRSATLWAMSQAPGRGVDSVLAATAATGIDLEAHRSRLSATGSARRSPASAHTVVIVGGGAAGMATAASLLARRPGLDICIVEPANDHYYQPGWTMVGAGVFSQGQTVRAMSSLMPRGVTWAQAAVRAFDPDTQTVELESGARIGYRVLVAAPGLTLDWDAIPGLREALGHDGVTSNYRYDLAPYTWSLVQKLERGTALFTQPPMPIKCAGAPQKAMYLSADHWRRSGRLNAIDIEFHTAGAVLFGVKDYVPALMHYIERYGTDLRLESTLVAVDGARHEAMFTVKQKDGTSVTQTRRYDMLHVCPPQSAPAVVKSGALAGPGGWIDIDDATLRHKRFDNVFALGDVGSTPNAKTAAAARKQAPVVAENVLATLDGIPLPARYDGYGSCPLTVERGKIVLAEFGYGGKLLPSFPSWLIDGTQPSRLAWLLKSEALPAIYWHAMLKGREWMCRPSMSDTRAA